jgi:hypothetical protein
MLRSKVIKTEAVNGRGELDLLQTGFEDFVYKGKTTPHTVTSVQVGRPDLIAYALYGDDRFWWILMKFNSISDVWNDLKAGIILKCPPKNEMERWYVKAIRRKGLDV